MMQLTTFSTRRVKSRQNGASLIEYAVLAALIVVAAVVAIRALGGGLSTTFTTILTAITGS